MKLGEWEGQGDSCPLTFHHKLCPLTDVQNICHISATVISTEIILSIFHGTN
jgi:hypothetical protein